LENDLLPDDDSRVIALLLKLWRHHGIHCRGELEIVEKVYSGERKTQREYECICLSERKSRECIRLEEIVTIYITLLETGEGRKIRGEGESKNDVGRASLRKR
jgi:hypothetical protein